MRRTIVFLFATILVMAAAPLAAADAPTREIVTAPADSVLSDQCAFPVLMRVTGAGIITTFTDKEGNFVRQSFHFPNNKTVLTNLDTGESVAVSTTGPALFKLDADGSSFFQITGRSPWAGHPITEASGIFLIAGRLLATFDSVGNRTSIDFTGKVVDLCDQLAS